jgi:hypothetical protein
MVAEGRVRNDEERKGGRGGESKVKEREEESESKNF